MDEQAARNKALSSVEEGSRSPDAGKWKRNPLYVKVCGEVLREEREARGWTREQMVKRMPSGIGWRTLLSYEHGQREPTISRLMELSLALGVSPVDVMQAMVSRLEAPELHPIRVEPFALFASDDAVLSVLRGWALRLLDEDATQLTISPRRLGDFAAISGCEPRELAEALLRLSPGESVGE